MGSTRRHNLECRIRRSSKSGGAEIRMKGSHDKFKCTLVEIMPYQRLLYLSVRLFILSGLWCSRFDALGQDRFTDEGAMPLGRSAVESVSYERTSRLSAGKTESTVYSAVKAEGNSGYVDDMATAAASAPARQPQPAAATIPGEAAAVGFISHLVVQKDRIHAASHQGRRQNSAGGPAGNDAALQSRNSFFIPHANTTHGSKTRSRSDSNNGIEQNNARFHITSEHDKMFISGSGFDLRGLTPGIPPVSDAPDSNSNMPVSSNSDASRTSGKPPHCSGLSVVAPGPREPHQEDYYREQRQIAHDHLRQGQQDEINTELQGGDNLSYEPKKNEYPFGDTALGDGYYNNVQNGGPPLQNVYALHQRPQIVRFLAAEAGPVFPSIPVKMQNDVHQMVPPAAGTTGVPEVEKEALALLSGIRGRNSGKRHWGYSGSEYAVPESFPYYYSTLPPQQIHALAGQQHFQPHLGAQYLRQGPEGQQQQQLHSRVHLMHQYQQPQQYYHGALTAPLYGRPPHVSAGMGRHSRDCRRFSPDYRLPRQRQRLQGQQVHQLLPQQAHPLQIRYMNTVPTHGTYAGTAALYPTTPSAAPAPGAANPYTRADEYVSVPIMNSGNTPPYDPNLLPLQHRQRSVEGMRLEAQLRNQHDAWRARERFSV